MNMILAPGFWLDASSWDGVAPVLEQAGNSVRALTLPGLESMDADRSAIGLRDHVDAVVATIDTMDGPVVLVGHSCGGGIAHAAADARSERVARVVYVDSTPLGVRPASGIDRWAPHHSLVGWSAHRAREPRLPVPSASPPRARGGWRLHIADGIAVVEPPP